MTFCHPVKNEEVSFVSSTDTHIRLAHGSGGTASEDLLKEVIFPILGTEESQGLDAALLDIGESKVAFTTDGFVVQPLEFPGGNIGKLSVCGTANDLAVMGARPFALAVGLILEEGLPVEVLKNILESLAQEAKRAGTRVVAGDTKVVRKGETDGIYITTSGIGICSEIWALHPSRIEERDAILVTGTIGDHGAAVLAARESFGLEGNLLSDCACIWPIVESIREFADSIHFMRDPTRGGLAAVLHEAVSSSNLGVELVESQLPVKPEVAGFTEILGIDPLYLACEGRILLIVRDRHAEPILERIKETPLGRETSIIGKVTPRRQSTVVLRNPYGSSRSVENMAGEQLPRIC